MKSVKWTRLLCSIRKLKNWIQPPPHHHFNHNLRSEGGFRRFDRHFVWSKLRSLVFNTSDLSVLSRDHLSTSNQHVACHADLPEMWFPCNELAPTDKVLWGSDSLSVCLCALCSHYQQQRWRIIRTVQHYWTCFIPGYYFSVIVGETEWVEGSVHPNYNKKYFPLTFYKRNGSHENWFERLDISKLNW